MTGKDSLKKRWRWNQSRSEKKEFGPNVFQMEVICSKADEKVVPFIIEAEFLDRKSGGRWGGSQKSSISVESLA